MIVILGGFVTAANQQQFVLLNSSIGRFNARCLDGSAPGYFFRAASTAANGSKWVVYFQGGGWCYTSESCRSRAKGDLGSSKDWSSPGYKTASVYMSNGVLSPNSSENWASSWNHVFVPYCDGTSWSGNLDEPLTMNERNESTAPLFYRGRANMQALVTDLIENRGMATASHVLIDGGSAGGLTSLFHADSFTTFLPNDVFFGAIVDAGWFRPDETLDHRNYTGSMRTMFAVSNATTNGACEAAHADDPAACAFAPIVFPFLTSRMFVMEGAYDSWQLHNILSFQCSTYGKDLSNCSTQENTSLLAYGDAMRRSVRSALSSTPHHADTAGAFVSSCIIHVQSESNEGHNMWHGPLKVNGRTPSDLVRDWFIGDGNDDDAVIDRQAIEDCDFPCNSACQMYT
jgi:hypothetical protein